MKVELTGNGNPILPFLLACAGRRIDLSGKEGDAHPLQLIPQRWRKFCDPFDSFVGDLVAVEAGHKSDGKALVESFRRVIYDATEIFDCYANLLPSRIVPGTKGERDALKTYKVTAKRLRTFTALLCNRCKHASAELQFLWACSPSNGRSGSRLLVSVYKGGNALIRDDQVHLGKMAGLGLVRLAHELAHNLLRIDFAAGNLMKALADQSCDPIPTVAADILLGAPLRRLAALQATRHSDESALHYGLQFNDDLIELTRVSAADLGPSVQMRATLTYNPPTTSYSVA